VTVTTSNNVSAFLKPTQNNVSAFLFWTVMPDWFVGFTTGGGSIGQVETRGLLKMGRGGIRFSRPVFIP
jgi:hypothetical protein